MNWSEIAPNGTSQWCDEWRSMYRGMGFSEHQKKNDAILAAHPNQESFDPLAFIISMSHMELEEIRVIEFGGWRGGLAEAILRNYQRVKSWLNVELATIAKENPECIDARYDVLIPDRFIWETSREPFSEFNVFASSHAIEHITFDHLKKLIEWLPESIKYVWLQAPLPESCTDNKWEGYGGTHILEVGWDQISEILRPRFHIVWRGGIRNECLIFGK